MRNVIKKIIYILLIAIVLIFIIFYFYIVYPFWGMPFNAQRHTNIPLTPAWALECWLWEDDENTASRVNELLDGYAKHDIPVRTIIIDSPWSTRYNDFTVDTIRYPDPAEWFKKLEQEGYRVILWMTCMVNSENDDTKLKNSEEWFNRIKEKDYLAGEGNQVEWWKGTGGFIDYTNPEAVSWWHDMQKKVFDYGIDGWKLDGTATFFSRKIGPLPIPYQRTQSGWLSTRRYMDLYYREEYQFGKSQNPEFITLARSIDKPYLHPEGFAPLDAAPVTWVGDQRHTWKSRDITSMDQADNKDLMMEGDEGIEEALRDILLSAKIGYCVVGSDIAGFSGKVIPPRLYIRWTQLSTFCGLFLNGGHGERALWKRSREELEIIRKYSWLHTELIPYIYSHVAKCHQGGKPLQRPVKGEYHYMFGDDLLVAPIYEDTLRKSVTLPAGQWRYFFNDRNIIEGEQTIIRDFALDEYPVYIREGAIIPMHIKRSYTGFGDESYANYMTILIYPGTENQFCIYHPDKRGETEVRVSNDKEKGALYINLRGEKISHILRIFTFKKPSRVELDGELLLELENWEYDTDNEKLIIKTDGYIKGDYVIM